MWNGKLKAVTFSFDDGVRQDERAIKILDKYGLKGTFNINSALLGLEGSLTIDGLIIRHDKVFPSSLKEIYKNHEIAVHTLTHPLLTSLDDKTVIYQVEEDRLQLEKLTGKKVVGMAYPCGGDNNDERVAEIIRKKTGVKYARTIKSTYNFDIQKNIFRFNPTISYAENCLFDLAKKFLSLNPDKPQLFYIWGHTYEMDAGRISWEKFEQFCKMIAKDDNVFYGTNSEVLLNF